MMNAPDQLQPPLQAPAGESVDGSPRSCFVECLPGLVAALLTLALYAITLGGTHVYDDLFIVRDDARLTNPQWWRYYWTDQYFLESVDRLYRPLTSMSYAIQAYSTGDLGWPFHLVNWLLAAGCAGVVAIFVQRLAGWWPALIAGLIFAAHPIHVEAVANIVGRAELLCGLGIFAGLTLFLKRPLTNKRVAAIVGCFLLALLTKEQGIVFPLLLGMLAGLQWLARPAGAPPVDRQQRRLAIFLGMGLVYITAGYLLFREMVLPMAWDRNRISWSMNPLVQSHGLNAWLMPIVLLGRYAALLVWPRRLSLDYGAEVVGSSVRWDEPYFYIGAAVLLGATVLLVWSVRRRDVPVAFAILGAGLLIGLVSNLPTLIGVGMAERLMFIPSGFLALLVGVWLTRVATAGRVARALVVAGLPILLVLGSLRTVTYAALWNDPAKLFQVGLNEQPRSVQLHRLVFHQHELKGDWVSALKVAESCMRVAPDWWQSYTLAAKALIELGDEQRAMALLQYAKDRCPHEDLVPEWMRLSVRLEEIHGIKLPTEDSTEPPATQNGEG